MSRPRTAAPSTANNNNNESQRWDDEDYESDDDDVGMFSFARPATGDQHNGPPLDVHSNSHHHPAFPPPSSDPFTPNPFSFAVPPSGNPHSPYVQSYPSAPPTAVTPALSPAAAYALSNASPSREGPRKRTSFSAPDSPHHVVGNPYESSLREGRQMEEDEEYYRTSSRSSRDKIEALDASWADQGGMSYAITPDGQAIMLNEMGEPVRLATSRERKMLEEAGVGDFVPYQSEPVYEEEEDSPYSEVRASVSNIDDPEMPVLTFRAWFLGLIFCTIISALNCFFSFRYPAPVITPILIQILSYPLGKLLARFLPITEWRCPHLLRRIGFPREVSLNPGPFNIKEHTILVIMGNVSTGAAYGLAFSVASDKFYGIAQGPGFDILLILTTQTIGFGAAGLCRRFLVWPASMIWPQNLVFCTLLNTFHAEDENDGGTTRFRFFLYAFAGAFAWYFLPGFLFVALSAFSWVCWIAPNNVVVNQLFGVSSGLGMGLFTFDWSQIAYIGSPLVVPWWAEVNIFFGFAIAFWIIAPIMYYKNVWESAYLPISTSQIFDRFGLPYNTSAVVDPVTLSLDEAAYQLYSPLYLPITYATVYGLAFMLSVAVVVHTCLYHGKTLVRQVRRVNEEDNDVHLKLMKNYPEVPNWWYLVFLAIAIALSIVTIACWDTRMPVWSLIVSLIIGFLYILPGGIVFAMTSTQISINLITELVGGYIIPNKPLANMLFKVYALQTVSAGLTFVQDLKIGHYMKIPPRATFTAQIVATILTSFVQVGVKRWLLATVPDICSPQQRDLLICPGATVFYSSSVFWGLIGPARQFGFGQIYHPILYWLLAGAVLPVVTWLLTKRYPNSFMRYVNVPVALTGAILMPPATGINFSSWFLVGFIFQYVLRRRQFRWWSKFNFVLSAAFDSGTVVSGIFIFLTLSLPKNGTIAVNWWGNDVFTKTLDWAGVSYKIAPPEGFGRTSW